MSKVQSNCVFTRRLYLILWLPICMVAAASGQTARFLYPHSTSEVRTDFAGNTSAFANLDAFIHSLPDHPTRRITYIRITGYSSVEGPYAVNEALARERVEQFYLYLRERYPQLYRYPHDLAWVAEDWVTLSDLVDHSALNEREEVMKIIRHIRVFDERESLLRWLNGGLPYQYMATHFFPQLRRVEVAIEYNDLPLEADGTVSEPLIYNVLDEAKADPSDSRSRATAKAENDPCNCEEYYILGRQPFVSDDYRFALKTNLLQWAGLQPDFAYTTPVANVALEYFFAEHWSVEVGAAYSYWRYNHNQKFQGISGYRVELVRQLYIRDHLPELSLGLYGRVGDYDIRHGGPEAENYTGDYWDAGLSAGLYLRLIGGFGLELGARAGYLRTNAIQYTIDGAYNWFEAKVPYSEIRVTGLNLSLVYRFR